MVNLDGTLQYESPDARWKQLPINLQRLQEIRSAVSIPMQFAGGLRSEADLEFAIDLGANRVVIGTAAIDTPELVDTAVRRWGAHRVVIAIEVRGGRVATHGWQRVTLVAPDQLGMDMYARGIRLALYTNVDNEGLLAGPDIEGTIRLSRATGLRVIASGGIGTLDHLSKLAEATADFLEGVVLGQALYRGAVDLNSAIALTRSLT